MFVFHLVGGLGLMLTTIEVFSKHTSPVASHVVLLWYIHLTYNNKQVEFLCNC